MNSSYLNYLPASYRNNDKSGFLAAYLKIFEKVLTGLDDGQLEGRKGIQQLLSADVIGNLFYPRFSFLFTDSQSDFIPPISDLPEQEKTQLLAQFNRYIGLGDTPDPLADFVASNKQSLSWQTQFETWLNEFLRWLGGWVDLVVDEQWSIDKKRNVVAQILALYRLRGTAFGLNSLLNLLLDLPLSLEGVAFNNSQQSTMSGRLSLTVDTPVKACVKVEDDRANAFVVRDNYTADMPVVAGYAPGLFLITVTLPDATNPEYVMTKNGAEIVLALLTKIQRLTEKLKPACTRYSVTLKPGIALIASGNSANLGNNTLLGS